MASMISENSYLIPDSEKERYAEDNRYILFITEIEAEQEENDELLVKIEMLRKNSMQKVEQLNISMREIKDKLAAYHLQSQKQDRYNNQILELISQGLGQGGGDFAGRNKSISGNQHSRKLSASVRSFSSRTFAMGASNLPAKKSEVKIKFPGLNI